MGYIELKTGQVALRPKKITPPPAVEYTLVWEGAEQTGTQWQYN